MKRVLLFIRQREISKTFPEGFRLNLEDNTSIIDAIEAADEEIKKKVGKFPVEKYKSLFQMVYHPYKNRSYNQVAVHAHVESEFLNPRESFNATAKRGNYYFDS